MTQRARRIRVVVLVVVALIVLLAFAGIGEGPNRPLEGTAARATATWLDGISAAAPILSALIAIGGVLATLYFTNQRELARQEHEREMQLNNEKRQAYATLAQLTAKAYDIDNPHSISELREAHAMVEILSDSPELLEKADSLVRMWREAWHSAHAAREAGEPDPFDTQQFKIQANLVSGLLGPPS
jgi:hypothetical protein